MRSLRNGSPAPDPPDVPRYVLRPAVLCLCSARRSERLQPAEYVPPKLASLQAEEAFASESGKLTRYTRHKNPPFVWSDAPLLCSPLLVGLTPSQAQRRRQQLQLPYTGGTVARWAERTRGDAGARAGGRAGGMTGLT